MRNELVLRFMLKELTLMLRKDWPICECSWWLIRLVSSQDGVFIDRAVHRCFSCPVISGGDIIYKHYTAILMGY